MAHPKQSSLLLSVRRYSAFFHELPKLLSGKESACSAGDPGDEGLIPGLGRSPGVVDGISFQYSCQETLIDRGVWWAIIHGVANATLFHS